MKKNNEQSVSFKVTSTETEAERSQRRLKTRLMNLKMARRGLSRKLLELSSVKPAGVNKYSVNMT